MGLCARRRLVNIPPIHFLVWSLATSSITATSTRHASSPAGQVLANRPPPPPPRRRRRGMRRRRGLKIMQMARERQTRRPPSLDLPVCNIVAVLELSATGVSMDALPTPSPPGIHLSWNAILSSFCNCAAASSLRWLVLAFLCTVACQFVSWSRAREGGITCLAIILMVCASSKAT